MPWQKGTHEGIGLPVHGAALHALREEPPWKDRGLPAYGAALYDRRPPLAWWGRHIREGEAAAHQQSQRRWGELWGQC